MRQVLRSAFLLLLVATTAASEVPPEVATYRGRPISLDLHNADIHSVFRMISEVSGYNIVAAGDISGKVTLRLEAVPWDQVLAIVLKSHKLHSQTEGNVILIVPLERVNHLYFETVK